MVRSAAEAIRRTHEWFDRNSGWAPPDDGTLAEWMSDGVCRCPDDCLVAPTEWCAHGLASWWLVLRTLDRPDGGVALEPARLAPHPDRLNPGRPDPGRLNPGRLNPGPLDPGQATHYVAAMDAHHRALLAGDAGYFDPISGLFVQTARSLWDRGTCCEQGCRHCPFIDR